MFVTVFALDSQLFLSLFNFGPEMKERKVTFCHMKEYILFPFPLVMMKCTKAQSLPEIMY